MIDTKPIAGQYHSFESRKIFLLHPSEKEKRASAELQFLKDGNKTNLHKPAMQIIIS